MSFDRNDPADLLALKTEVNTDPNALGYVPENTQSGVLDIINPADPLTPLRKPKVSAALLRTEITHDAYINLVADEQEWIRWITGSNGFEEENIIVTDDFNLQLTGAGDPNASFWHATNRDEMVNKMIAIINVPASRAENLFGFGTVISSADWVAARDS
jgi:hypothetical protein